MYHKKEYTVYMLHCCDDSYYVGMTSDLELRLGQHRSGWSEKAYTHTRRPVTLVYTANFTDVYDAISWERKIKRWSRKKKEALMRGEYDSLIFLSKRKRVQEKGNKYSSC